MTLTRAPVIIDGETLFAVRGLSAYPAEERARVIAERIRTLAANRAIASPTLTLDDQPGLIRILGNGILLAVVYDEDAALEAVDRSILAEAYRLRVIAAIERVSRREAAGPAAAARADGRRRHARIAGRRIRPVPAAPVGAAARRAAYPAWSTISRFSPCR